MIDTLMAIILILFSILLGIGVLTGFCVLLQIMSETMDMMDDWKHGR